MPTNQPSSAPQHDAPRLTDDLTAAAVLHDEALDQPAGGVAGAVPLGGDGAGKVGAETPNSPMSAGLPRDSDAKAEAEARTRAVDAAPPEPGHGSQ